MTQAVVPATEVAINEPQEKEHLLTFQEYLDYEGEPDVIYELVRGKLIPMSAPTLEHTKICEFLVYKLQRYFAAQNLSLVAKTTVGVRTEENSSRIPDAIVCHQSLWEQISERPGAGVLDFDEKPILVVEIVSSNPREDYVIKRYEYEAAGIAEYWIVDPKNQLLRVCANPSNEEGYRFLADFTSEQSIVFRHHGYLLDDDRLRLLVRAPFIPALWIDAISTIGNVLSLLHLEGWAFTTITYKFSGLMSPR